MYGKYNTGKYMHLSPEKNPVAYYTSMDTARFALFFLGLYVTLCSFKTEVT